MSQFFQGNKQVYFETVCCKAGKACNLNYHTKRVYYTIQKYLDLETAIIPPTDKLLRCKIIYNKKAIENISYYPYTKRKIQRLKIVQDDTIEYNYKYLDRTLLDNLFEKKDDCDEIIIVKNGLVADTSIANISIYKNKQWLTPKTPLLQGTLRARLLDEQKIIEKDITLDDLLRAKKLALSNAMIGFDILQDYEIVL